MSMAPVELQLPSALESVDAAEEAVLQYAGSAGFSEEDLQKVSMAVRESLVNAVLHGNQYDPGKTTGLRVELDRGKLVITVTDQGAGFDLSEIADPLAPENLMKQSGRGIFLIRTFMDELHVRRRKPQGTEVKMVKYPSESAVTG